MTPDQDPYYGRPECSNSDLSSLNKYWQIFQITYDIEKAQNFGTLLDCMITEPARVDYFKFTCAGIQFGRADFELAEEMKKAFFRDEFCRVLYNNSDMQVVTVRERFKITYLGYTFYLPFRMKADFNAKRLISIEGTCSSYPRRQSIARTRSHHRQDRWFRPSLRIARWWRLSPAALRCRY